MAGKDFLVPHKNGTFAFRRRYPADLAKHFRAPIRWILLDTHSAAVAKDLAREKAVEFDQEMARLRIEAGLAGQRLGALSVGIVVFERADVLLAIGQRIGALSVELAVLEFTDVLTAIGERKPRACILDLLRRHELE